MVSGSGPLLIVVLCRTGRHIMSSSTEQIIDIVVEGIPDFTKLNDTDMRWDGSAATSIHVAHPTLIIDGVLANTVFHAIEISHVLEIAE